MRNLFLSIVFSGMAVMLPQAVSAHSDEYLAKVEAPHGGQLRMAGPFHLELVAKDGELRLYVTDHMENGLYTAGGSAKANIFDKAGKRITSVNLEPVFGNMMKATGDFKITPDTAISVFVVLEGSGTETAQFTSLGQKSASGDDESETEAHDHSHADESNDASEDGGED